MVKFNLNDKEFLIPDYTTIENYSKIFKVKELFTDEYFSAKLINLVTGAPLDELLKSDYEKIDFMATHIISLIPIEKNLPFIDKFEIDGIKYGFFPNWRDLTFAEFIDMDTISTKKQEELLNMLHILAAIMYRPIEHEISEHNFLIEEYDVKTMVKRSELFKKKMDVKIILGAMVFFFKLEKRYSLYSQASLIPKIKWTTKMKIIWKLRKLIWAGIFKKRTVGFSSSTELLEMILQNTTLSTKKT